MLTLYDTVHTHFDIVHTLFTSYDTVNKHFDIVHTLWHSSHYCSQAMIKFTHTLK